MKALNIKRTLTRTFVGWWLTVGFVPFCLGADVCETNPSSGRKGDILLLGCFPQAPAGAKRGYRTQPDGRRPNPRALPTDFREGRYAARPAGKANKPKCPLFPAEAFLLRSPNVLAQVVPDDAEFAAEIKVIDVPAGTHGQNLTIAMNSDTDEALAYLK